jgi:ribosomal protein L11 methyltransferase
LANDSQRETIWLDPGLSFGTGDHFTTRFCLEMIDRVVDGKEIASMLDVGTGSSILAIAAARLGTRKTVGTDNDEIALEQARKNVELNGLAGQIELYTSDIMLAAPEGAFDLVCANVYTTVLIAIAPALAASTKKILVLSGIRDHELDEVAMAFTARGMKEFFRDGDGEWGGLAFRK